MPRGATAFRFRLCVDVDVNGSFRSKPTFSAQLPALGIGQICRWSNDSGANPRRPRVAFKGLRHGSCSALVHTAANEDGSMLLVDSFKGSEKCADEDDVELEHQGVSNNEEKPIKSLRRQRGSISGAPGLSAIPDLLTIPGVGPRNLIKLVDKGIAGVPQLKQLYRDKFLGESNQKMVEYLRSSVGIIHVNHAESITTYIKESVDEELKEDGSGSGVKPEKRRLTFCVEGNISVGKTTFLQRIANETLELQDLVEIVPEPIDKWQNVGPDHFNILDAFYAEPQRYAYTFQNYVFVTRLMQERESSGGVKPLRLMERSVFTDRMVPALVLDCEPNVDFNKDIEAKQLYARQVAEFFEFVKRKKDVAPSKAGNKAGKSSQQQVSLPLQGGLWVPDGKFFPELDLDSLNLGPMPFVSG